MLKNYFVLENISKEISVVWLYMFPIILLTLSLTLIYLFVKIVLQILSNKKSSIFLEITPPHLTEQSSFTTTQLFNSIYGLLKQRNWIYHIFDISKSYSFEIFSTKESGIKYILKLNTDDETIIRKSLVSYLPGIKIKEVNDYISDGLLETINIRSTKDFIFPIKRQDNLSEHDPIAYITGAMTKLEENELISMQIVVSPINRRLQRIISKYRGLIASGGDLSSSNIFVKILFIFLQILILPIGIIVFIFSNGNEGPFLKTGIPKLNKTSSFNDDLLLEIKNKINEPVFSTSFRFLIKTNSKANFIKAKKGLISTLSSFSNTPHQSLTPVKYLRLRIIKKINLWLFKKRINLNRLVLSSSELSNVFHFPYTSTTKTENLSKSYSKELPAPISLKQKETKDIYFAKNIFNGSQTMIGLTKEERRRHVYILGATGTGKSTMILSMLKSDIENNKGVCLIDPHGDLSEQILSIIPRERIKDVVYFNPDDIAYPVGINLLELTPNLSADDALREKEFIVESIISVFNKIYSDKYSGPRMEYILRNAIYTVFTVPGATLFTVNKLLINSAFRKSVVSKLTDENLIEFWKYEFGKSGDFQKVSMVMPITNKIGRFLFSPTAKRILGQSKSTINFDSIMDEEKILICNLSKGKIGEDNSSVFGVLALAKIQLAALKRSRMKTENRKDFYLYVDEFQNFATNAFAQILSEARKYKLCATLAHQTTSQIEDTSLTNVILANTGTVICFRTANPEDEKLILPQFRPYVDEGEISNLPSFNFFMKLGALNPEEAFSGVTIPVEIKENRKLVKEIVESSRALYATEWKEEVKENYLDTIEKMRGKKSVNNSLILP